MRLRLGSIVAVTILALAFSSCESPLEKVPARSQRDSVSHYTRLCQKFMTAFECKWSVAAYRERIFPYYELSTKLNNLVTGFVDTSFQNKESHAELLTRVADFNARYSVTLHKTIKKSRDKYLQEDVEIMEHLKFISRIFCDNDQELNYIQTHLDILRKHLIVLYINYPVWTEEPCLRDFPEWEAVSLMFRDMWVSRRAESK
jgi:hypothetical protein